MDGRTAEMSVNGANVRCARDHGRSRRPGRLWQRIGRAGIAGLCLSVLGAGVGDAATVRQPKWGSVMPVVAPGVRLPSSAAVGVRGQAAIFSMRPVGGTGVPEVIERPSAGRPWGVPHVIPTPIALRPAYPGGGQVFLNRRDDAMAVWSAGPRNATFVSAARRHGSKVWSRPRALPAPSGTMPTGGQPTYAVALSNDGRGRMVRLVCTAADACATDTLVSASPGAPWQAAGGEVALPKLTGDVVVAIGSGGDALVAWRTDGPSPQILATYRPRAATAWEAPQAISPVGQPAGDGWLAGDVGEVGDAAVSWGVENTAASAPAAGDLAISTGIEVAVRPHGASWQAPDVVLAPGTIGTSYRSVSADADGGVLASWSEFAPDATMRVSAALRSPTGGWGTPTTLVTEPSYDGDPVIPISRAILRAGRAYVPWSADLGFGGVHHAGLSFRDRGAPSWTAVAPFSDLGAGFRVYGVGFDGSVLTVAPAPSPARVDFGLGVREFSARAKPPPTRILRIRFAPAGSRTRITFALAGGAGRLVTSFWRGDQELRSLVTATLPAGPHTTTVALSPATYSVYLALCDARACRDLPPTAIRVESR